jgi:MFS family permease
MGTMIVSWGVLVMCMAAPRRFAGMAAIRTLLGATESLISPGFVLLVSRFYRRDEQPLRVGVWYCCNGVGNFLGALVSYAMGHVQVRGVPNWSWIFILNGAVTIVFGVVFLVFCPESPETCAQLTRREKAVALERVRTNKSSLACRTWKWGQFREAVLPWRDPQPWAYFWIVMCITVPNGGISNFLHLIVSCTPTCGAR